MLIPDPQSQARSTVSSSLSSARSAVQRNPTFISLLLYFTCLILLFVLVGVGAVYSPLVYKPTFGLVQAAALLLGIAHLGAAARWLSWYNEESLLQGSLLALFGTLGAMLGIAWVNWLPRFTPPTSSLPFVLAAIPFAVPYFVREAYRAWCLIPQPEYKLWYYRPSSGGPDLARMDLSNFMVVHFWMSRRFGETLFHDFSSKAPYEMRFGDLFHIFLTDYNLIKPDQSIQYVDENGRPYGWLFYAKQPWWKPRRYYDPDHTFRDNFLRQGSIIVARRVPADAA